MLAVGERETEGSPHNKMEQLHIFCLVEFLLSLLLVTHAVQCIRSVPMFFAKRLYKSMKVNAGCCTRNIVLQSLSALYTMAIFNCKND